MTGASRDILEAEIYTRVGDAVECGVGGEPVIAARRRVDIATDAIARGTVGDFVHSAVWDAVFTALRDPV